MAQRMFALLLAGLASKASAQIATGVAGCPCITEYPEGVTTPYDCDFAYAANGKCVNATPKGLPVPYPGDYGITCKTYKEPGHPSCWNLTSGTELPTATGRRLNSTNTTGNTDTSDTTSGTKASWCDDPWCYVDPCQCDASDVGQSTYFNDEISFSYSTCGSVDKYTEAETTLTLGNSKCENEASAASSRGFLMLVGVLVASMLIVR